MSNRNQPDRTLYKVDTKQWEIRQVTGQPWPGQDSEGDKCFVNTHFESEADAIKELIKQVTAHQEISRRAVITAEYHLRHANQQYAAANGAVAKLATLYPDDAEPK